VPKGKLDILVASPECTYFSNASGGVPLNDQSRASANYVKRWLTDLNINKFLLENVPEFQTWGPLTSDTKRPIPNRKGEYFNRFCREVERLGYHIEHRVLIAANYGDATTRKRFFMIGSKGSNRIKWPDQSHSKPEPTNMFADQLKPWRTAQEIINWENKGKSIYTRKKPLSDNTLRRIFKGIERYSGIELKPFLIEYHGGANGDNRSKSLDAPLPTQDCSNRFGLVQPFVVSMDQTSNQGHCSRSVDQPLKTIAGKGMLGIVNPILIEFNGTGGAAPVDLPVKTITGADRFGLAQPIVYTDEAGKKWIVDIYFRMLEVDELARAMSFPEGYLFMGTRDDRVKQIGNSVPVRTAQALCHSMLAN